MVKPGKSSASSNTRKKHAKKSGPGENETGPESASNNNNNNAPHQKKQRGQKLTKAQKKALPKIKQYIPPPKPPAPPIPDPLDGQGLARTLPAELVVVLRRLGKKDDVTRRKGLEELKDGWVGVSISSQGDELEREMKETALLSAVPVWVSSQITILLLLHFPPLTRGRCTTWHPFFNRPSIEQQLYSFIMTYCLSHRFKHRSWKPCHFRSFRKHKIGTYLVRGS